MLSRLGAPKKACVCYTYTKLIIRIKHTRVSDVILQATVLTPFRRRSAGEPRLIRPGKWLNSTKKSSATLSSNVSHLVGLITTCVTVGEGAREVAMMTTT